MSVTSIHKYVDDDQEFSPPVRACYGPTAEYTAKKCEHHHGTGRWGQAKKKKNKGRQAGAGEGAAAAATAAQTSQNFHTHGIATTNRAGW